MSRAGRHVVRSYEGVRADYERWGSLHRLGGHLLLHDAVAERELAVPHEEVARLAGEIEKDELNGFETVGAAGTLLHVRRLSAWRAQAVA